MTASTFLHKQHLGICPECKKNVAQDVLDEATLRREYLDEKLTASQICRRYNRSQHYVSDLLKLYGIETRRQNDNAIDEETLKWVYVYEKMPTRDICDYVGCSEKTLYKYLHRYGIPHRRG